MMPVDETYGLSLHMPTLFVGHSCEGGGLPTTAFT